MRQEPAAKLVEDDGRPVDARRLMAELAERWRGSQTLEYRSEAVLNHAGEFRAVVRVHAQLRRPHLARILFWADRAETTQLRVSTGKLLYWRGAATPLRPGRTLHAPFRERLTEDIPHPLDETAYSTDQFFSRTPFYPPPAWGTGKEPMKAEAVRIKRRDTRTGKQVEAFRIRLTRGTSQDTLWLEPVSLRPLELSRVGDHAGTVQELLHETFTEFNLGVNLPPSRFTWSVADEAGETIKE
jgi:hypothetical protein